MKSSFNIKNGTGFQTGMNGNHFRTFLLPNCLITNTCSIRFLFSLEYISNQRFRSIRVATILPIDIQGLPNILLMRFHFEGKVSRELCGNVAALMLSILFKAYSFSFTDSFVYFQLGQHAVMIYQSKSFHRILIFRFLKNFDIIIRSYLF